jgi:hypothetical protein
MVILLEALMVERAVAIGAVSPALPKPFGQGEALEGLQETGRNPGNAGDQD